MSAKHKLLFIIIIIITSYIPCNIPTKVDKDDLPYFDFFNEDQDSTITTEIEVSTTEESTTESTEPTSEETTMIISTETTTIISTEFTTIISTETTTITSSECTTISSIENTTATGTINSTEGIVTDITLQPDLNSTVNGTGQIGGLNDEVDRLSNSSIEREKVRQSKIAQLEEMLMLSNTFQERVNKMREAHLHNKSMHTAVKNGVQKLAKKAEIKPVIDLVELNPIEMFLPTKKKKGKKGKVLITSTTIGEEFLTTEIAIKKKKKKKNNDMFSIFDF